MAEKDFNFPTVDPSDVEEVLMTTSKRYVLGSRFP